MTMLQEFRLTSDFALPANPPTHEKHCGHLTVRASSLCIGRASRVCDDIAAALEYGAVPEAQLVIRDRINQANLDSLPLSCTLSFGA